MGCDIHAHFEIKLNGKWEHYDQPKINRNYCLFAKMAGVRGEGLGIEPISKPKGLPKNLSNTTEFDVQHWDGDGHTHSWLNADEIEQVYEYHKSLYEPEDQYTLSMTQWGYLFGNGWEDFKKYRSDYPKEIEDIRMVFWFDN